MFNTKSSFAYSYSFCYRENKVKLGLYKKQELLHTVCGNSLDSMIILRSRLPDFRG